MSKLLGKRYEVINDYPNSYYKVGCILTVITDPFDSEVINFANRMIQLLEANQLLTADKDFGKYPHLFRPMEWWEKRTAEEMPEYLKSKITSGVYKCENHNINEKYCFCGCIKAHYENYMPATEAEFLEYLKTK